MYYMPPGSQDATAPLVDALSLTATLLILETDLSIHAHGLPQ